MDKKIITLLTDFGYSDYYVAAIKGTILSKLTDVNIVDISHDVTPFSIREAGFILGNCYKFFPEGTIHIIGINSEASINTPHILVKAANQYFIAADNGILPMALNNIEMEIFEIDYIQDSPVFTFSSKDVFAEIAVLIASGQDYSQYTNKLNGFNKNYLMSQPVVDGDLLKGHVLFIDNYRNIITNITRDIFYDFVRKSSFEILFKSDDITKISKAYSDVRIAEIAVFFGSHGYMEIAMYKANAADLLGIDYNSNILVQRK
ncbi:MAG: SAM-dependent chlorinase/fluorinase [Bacteroidales bacterium]|jgi:S-adenosylmethionine hydrolase|nr:SAM-dependent chlorinase/fluorinase [Bacteroidales bacterium]